MLSLLFSEFVSIKIIHKLYEICCERRFADYLARTRDISSRLTSGNRSRIGQESVHQLLPQMERLERAKDRTQNLVSPSSAYVSTLYSSNKQQPPKVKQRISRLSSRRNCQHITSPGNETRTLRKMRSDQGKKKNVGEYNNVTNAKVFVMK